MPPRCGGSRKPWSPRRLRSVDSPWDRCYSAATLHPPIGSGNGRGPDLVIVDKKRIDGMMVLSVEGIIKLGRSAEFLAENLKSILDTEGGHVLLDLSQINYIDSTGIGELVAYLGRFAESGRHLVLVNPSERIRKLLAISQLEQLFTIYDDLDSALAGERGAVTGKT